MSEKEMMQRNIEDFSRIQRYMLLAEKGSDAYKAMKERKDHTLRIRRKPGGT